MARNIFSLSPSALYATRKLRRRRSFFSTAFLLTGLIIYVAFFSPYGPSWHLPSHFYSNSLELASPNEARLVDPKLANLLPNPTPSPPSLPSPASDTLILEQIRDIVAHTRGFFSRDYSLHLGWNNVRYIFETALLQAELLNRTLVLPSFIYARACEYDITVCADYATMVNKGDALGSYEWSYMPIEQQMGFRIPISVMVNMTHLRNRQPVITASEYLRLHGQDPESESSSGFWPRDSYHSHPNVFETDKTKMPSLFVIDNDWYDPMSTTRVDYIPEAMKTRGNLERHPGPDNYDGSTEYWPYLEPTMLSRLIRYRGSLMDWSTAKSVLEYEPDLVGKVDLDDDNVVEELLNAHGWEVVHSFKIISGVVDMAKAVVIHRKEVAQRSSIRGFRDDYHDVDADVIVLAGETHLERPAGAMHFTEELARKRYASTVVHSLIPLQKVIDLAEVLASRMRLRTGGRLWMGAHMRRGDFLDIGWMEMEPGDHVQLVKRRLEAGREVLVDLHHHRNWTTYDIDGAQPDPELTTSLPPLAGDPFFIATDERDPDALREIAAAGAVFLSDLLTTEDYRAFGWPLMITDVVAIVEQQVLVHSGFFHGLALSSFAGVVLNLRAARGADPRTMVLD